MTMKDALPPDPPRTDHDPQPSEDERMKGALAMPVTDDDVEAAAELPKM
jgi:hypothetical protein